MGQRVAATARQHVAVSAVNQTHLSFYIDGEPAGSFETERVFFVLISWSGLDIGLDRGSPVSDYAAPFEFTGTLDRVLIELDDDQELDAEAVLDHESAAD